MARSGTRHSRRSPEVKDEVGVRSSRRNRGDLSGLDITPESDGDDEYNEQDDSRIDEDQNDEDYGKNDSFEEDEESSSTKKRVRGQKRRIVTEDEEDGEDADEGSKNKDDDLGSDEAEIDDDEDEEEEEEEAAEEEEEEEQEKIVKPKPKKIIIEEKRRGPKKRGRKKVKLTITDDGFFDEEGNEMHVKDDEVIVDDEDPKGQEKIDENGNLKGDRRFRVKTFTVLGNGDKKFMVSTEPARLVGFRDSYLLFKTHRSLFKKVCTNEEKLDLIDRHIIPNSYKGRSVNLVAARSIFREFGARIIHDGKKVIDDFWEQKAIDNGDVPGEYADPAELYAAHYKITGPSTDPNSNAGSTPIAGMASVSYQTDPTWMYQIALKTRDYNSKLLERRSQAFIRGIRDVYTGLNFYPLSTQPTKLKLVQTGRRQDETIIRHTKIFYPNIRKKVTGLKDVDPSILNDLEDDVKNAVIEQQEFEKSV